MCQWNADNDHSYTYVRSLLPQYIYYYWILCASHQKTKLPLLFRIFTVNFIYDASEPAKTTINLILPFFIICYHLLHLIFFSIPSLRRFVCHSHIRDSCAHCRIYSKGYWLDRYPCRIFLTRKTLSAFNQRYAHIICNDCKSFFNINKTSFFSFSISITKCRQQCLLEFLSMLLCQSACVMAFVNVFFLCFAIRSTMRN